MSVHGTPFVVEEGTAVVPMPPLFEVQAVVALSPIHIIGATIVPMRRPPVVVEAALLPMPLLVVVRGTAVGRVTPLIVAAPVLQSPPVVLEASVVPAASVLFNPLLLL
mmetsp:Transcript_47456/g.132313  ORF Transcript_47456/g.132313 Transcript_47456/m.132313 type:complete len:108 (+) Transcript_47456:122-445(+)